MNIRSKYDRGNIYLCARLAVGIPVVAVLSSKAYGYDLATSSGSSFTMLTVAAATLVSLSIGESLGRRIRNVAPDVSSALLNTPLGKGLSFIHSNFVLKYTATGLTALGAICLAKPLSVDPSSLVAWGSAIAGASVAVAAYAGLYGAGIQKADQDTENTAQSSRRQKIR